GSLRPGSVDVSRTTARARGLAYNLVLDILGEGSLTLWLIVMGLNVQRWHKLTDASGSGGRMTARGPFVVDPRPTLSKETSRCSTSCSPTTTSLNCADAATTLPGN